MPPMFRSIVLACTLSTVLPVAALAHAPAYPAVQINVTTSASLPADFCVEQIQPISTDGFSYRGDDNWQQNQKTLASYLSVHAYDYEPAIKTMTIPLVVSSNGTHTVINRVITATVTQIADPRAESLVLPSIGTRVIPEVNQALAGIPNAVLGALRGVISVWNSSQTQISSMKAIKAGNVTESAIDAAMSTLADADMLMMSAYACPNAPYLRQEAAMSQYLSQLNSAVETLRQNVPTK